MRIVLALLLATGTTTRCGRAEEPAEPPAVAASEPASSEEAATAPDERGQVPSPSPEPAPTPTETEPPATETDAPPTADATESSPTPDATPTAVLTGRPTTRPDLCIATRSGWPAEYTACKRDSDCTMANTSCCGCSAGGRLQPVAKKYVPCVVPLASDCNQMGGCPASYHCFESTPKCENRRCVQGPTKEIR